MRTLAEHIGPRRLRCSTSAHARSPSGSSRPARWRSRPASAEPSGDVAPGPGGPDAVPVTAVDTRFEPDRLELPAGQEIQVEIHNEGSGTHDFTIETLDLSTGPIRSGEVANATFTVPEGETPFECTLHPGMDGVIVGT
jgi:plastocyanin